MPSATDLTDLVPGAPRGRRPSQPPPRKPQATLSSVPPPVAAPAPVAAPPAPELAPSVPSQTQEMSRPDSARVRASEPAPVAVHVPPQPVEMRALGQRIREPFYAQLTTAVFELDRRRLRTNKTEILEYLLASLPSDTGELDRLAGEISAFRAAHPRR